MTSFCRFTVGTEGTSAANVRYVSRKDAVKERLDGAFFRNAPEEVVNAKGYAELRQCLEAFAWAREESERARFKRSGRTGSPRSHYRCVLSFEGEWTTPAIRRLVDEWLRDTLPNAVAASFVHRNTQSVHAHVWLDARGVDGKKLDFSPKEWRSIGKKWDRLYTRELERRARTEGLENERNTRDEKGRTLRTDRRAPGGATGREGTRDRAKAREEETRLVAQSERRALRSLEALRRNLTELGGKEREKGDDREP